MKEPENEPSGEEIMMHYDWNGDGVLSAEETYWAYRDMHDEVGIFDNWQTEAEREFLEMDLNLDGLASYDEFVSYLMDDDEEYGR